MTEPVEAAVRPPTTPTHAASRRIARNAIVRSVGDVVAKAASIVFFVAVARQLGRHGFGDFTFALALGAVLSAPAGFGTDGLLAREVAREPERVHSYLPNVIAIKSATAMTLLLFAAVIGVSTGASTQRLLAVLILGAGLVIENLAASCYAALQAFERMEFMSVSVIAQRVVTTAVTLIVLASGGGVVAVSVVYASGATFALLVALWALRRFVVRVRWRIDPKRWLPIVLRGLPIGVATVLFLILLKLDTVLLGLFRASAEVGVYAAAFRLVETTMFVSWSIGAAMLPWFARQQVPDADSIGRGYELGLKALMAVLIPGAVLFGLLAEPLVELLYGPGYEGAVTPLRVLAALTVLYGVSYFTGVALTARDRPGAFARAAGVALVFNLVANLALIPPYGATGAAVAAVASGTVLALGNARSFTHVAGRIRFRRIVGGPVAGGLAMAGAVLVADMPLAPSVALGGLAYLTGLVAVEWIAWPNDLRLARELVRLRRRAGGKR